MKRVFLLFVAFLAISVALAQAPEAFKYQAVLRDASGNPVVSTSKTVTVELLSGSAAGTSVYKETHAITTTAQGIINLNIGGGTVVSGTFASINWGAAAYYVKVTVDAVDISTGQLLSVPYALYAKSSGSNSAGTGGTSNYIQLKMSASQGSVAVGTVVAFNTTFKSNGITSTGNGINLKAGVTYRLETGLDIYAATDLGYLGYTIVNAAGSLGSTAYAMNPASPSTDAMRNNIVVIYTPTVDETVYVKITDQRMGTGTIRSDFNPYFIATEMSVSAASTSSTSASIQVVTQDERDALTTSTGLMVYNTTTNKLNIYNGTTWKNYDGTSAATVKLDPTITWANPANIVEGTALSATQLNATASVAGTFVYNPAIGTVLSVGNTQNLTVNFTPTDAAHYNTATKTVTISVIAKTTPTITWANPANIFVGTALSATQLNATASVAGAFVYTPASGTVLSLGNAQNLTVNFTPTDAANYNTATKTVTINVIKQTPTITWANPADIIVGVALSATQLNATASVAGAFVYTPASGTVLAVGNAQSLSVAFTPTDVANYNTANKTVYITVKPAGPTDGDGNVYTPVVIGTQTWLSTNLKTTKYNDATAIQTGHYYIYGQSNNTGNPDPYGYLYTSAVAYSTNVCPTGYHVPTSTDWQTLVSFLGTSQAGGRMKSISYWASPNVGAHDSGFNAYGGGNRSGSGSYSDLFNYGYFWGSNGYFIFMSAAYPSAPINPIDYQSGASSFSIRCVKNP